MYVRQAVAHASAVRPALKFGRPTPMLLSWSCCAAEWAWTNDLPQAVNLADPPQLPLTSHLQPFLNVVRQGLGPWMDALVERAIQREQAAAATHGRATATPPVLVQLLQRRRLELVHALTTALLAQLEVGVPHPAAVQPDQPPLEALRLTLISEAQIDDEIETARIVQLIESEAEVPLEHLTGLSSRLHGSLRAELVSVPLNPAACACALRRALAELAPEAGMRAGLLRALGSSMGSQMREVYAELARWLQARGVEAVGGRIAGPGDSPLGTATARFAAESLVEVDRPAPPETSMRELVAWAQRTLPAPLDDTAAAGAADVADDTAGLELRLDAEPQPVTSVQRLHPVAAEGLMRRLFSKLRQQAAQSSSMAGLLSRLEQLARRLAADDPQLWSDPAHPWWQLLDCLLAAADVHDDLAPQGQRELGRSLDTLIGQLLHSPQPDARACLQAARQVQQRASQLLERSAAPGAQDVAELQREADREELELTVRSQVVQQLRSTPTSGLMRRFLMDPWTQVMVALALRHGVQSEPVAAAALVVDDLILATAQPGQKVSRAQRAVLLRQVSQGLAVTSMPKPRIDAELVELAQTLRDPPPFPSHSAEAWQEEPAGPVPAPVLLDLHAGLPTVPLGCGGGGAGDEPAPTPLQWLATLQPGVLCRLFLQGMWMTARLSWVAPGQRLFLFQSRHGGRSHTLTQRMLNRLREAGLATSIEDNLLRVQAMDSLVRSTLD